MSLRVMDKIYVLYVVPEGEGTFAYRAFDTRENAEFIERSLKEQYVAKIITKIVEVDFDGKVARAGEYQRIIPEGVTMAERVNNPDVPGGLPPRMPDDCPWCHQKTDPHYDTALGVNYWHPKCLTEAYDKLTYMNSDEFKAVAPPPPDLRLPVGTPIISPVGTQAPPAIAEPGVPPQ